MRQYRLRDSPGIPLGDMGGPTGDRLLHLGDRLFLVAVLGIEACEGFTRSFDIAGAKADSIGIYAKS